MAALAGAGCGCALSVVLLQRMIRSFWCAQPQSIGERPVRVTERALIGLLLYVHVQGVKGAETVTQGQMTASAKPAVP